jgi:hypothetical protein
LNEHLNRQGRKERQEEKREDKQFLIKALIDVLCALCVLGG